jgi:pyrroline-5-carboxylate reductase
VPNTTNLFKENSVILLAVKPQTMANVLHEVRTHHKNHLIITVAAGLSFKYYEKFLGKKSRIIRVMPNTPAQIGLGATTMMGNKNVTKNDLALCQKLFSAVGLVLPLKNESLMHATAAVAASGPAFVYYFAQALMAAGQKQGLNAKQVKILVLQTLWGSTEMMRLSPESPEELTKKVTSKKGMTLAGLAVLKKKGFTKVIEACIHATIQRSQELGRLLETSVS